MSYRLKVRPASRLPALWVAALAASVLVASVAVVHTANAANAPLVRQLPGLVIGSVIHDGIDYEGLSVLKAVDADGTRTVFHWTMPDPQAPGGRKEQTANFLMRAADLASARRLILTYIPGDPEVLPGTVIGAISRAVFAELKEKGEVPIVLGAARRTAAGELASLFAGRKYYRGTLKRIEAGTVPFPVLLDGRRVNVPAVHAKGDVAVGGDGGSAEFWFLDDADRAVTLKWVMLGATAQAVRIENARVRPASPGSAGGSIAIGNGAAGAPITAGLDSSACRAELHGVYFNTGSAELLPESSAALAEVAAALNAHTDWHVVVEGHTDNIGAADSNVALSTRRAEAVRRALVSQNGVAATRLDAKGFGATRPVESNDTLEGRAHNRRVELSRRCP
ncbi:MAG: OmpA family protein [Gammaproteobacteria bacterium]